MKQLLQTLNRISYCKLFLKLVAVIDRSSQNLLLEPQTLLIDLESVIETTSLI